MLYAREGLLGYHFYRIFLMLYAYFYYIDTCVTKFLLDFETDKRTLGAVR